MRVISTFLQAPVAEDGRRTVLFAFDTLVDDKGLVVGVTVGRVNGPDLAQVVLSPAGMAIVDRAMAHREANDIQGPLVLAGVASVGGAKQRVCKLLAAAQPGALVLLVCANDKVYDAVTPCLGIQYQTADPNTQ